MLWMPVHLSAGRRHHQGLFRPEINRSHPLRNVQAAHLKKMDVYPTG